MRTLAVCALALFALAGSASTVGAARGSPKIVQAEFYEDLEDGQRYNVDAKFKGEADKVTARLWGRCGPTVT